MSEHQFLVTRSEDTFQLGRIEGEPFSGVYLSPAYMDRLREVMYAATLRIQALEEINLLPDAVKNVLGIVKRLTKVHSEQMQKEGYPWTDADRAAAEEAKKQLKAAWDALRSFPPGDDSDE